LINLLSSTMLVRTVSDFIVCTLLTDIHILYIIVCIVGRMSITAKLALYLDLIPSTDPGVCHLSMVMGRPGGGRAV